MSSSVQKIKEYRRTIVLLIIVVAILSAVAVISNRPRPTVLAEGSTTEVEIRDIEQIVSTEGNLSGKLMREIYLPTGAKVKDAIVSVGSTVESGDTIAVIEVTNAFGGTEEEKIKATLTGMITERNYIDGDIVNNPSLAAFVIVDNSSYLIEAYVNENEIVNVKRNQTVAINFPAISLDDVYAGTVTFVSPAPVSTSGPVNYLVQIQPKKLPPQKKLGMSADIEILTQKADDVLAIPDSYLIEKDDEFVVKKVTRAEDEITITEVTVEIGLRTNTFVEITKGLKEGEEVVEPSFTATRSFGLFGN